MRRSRAKAEPEVTETVERSPEELLTGDGHLSIPTVRVERQQIASVTPEVARMLIALCEYNKQRPTSPSTIQRYADLMRAGEFGLSLGWIGWVGMKPYLINGKHRLEACVLAEVPFDFILVETVHEEKGEVDATYANQDRGKDRTAADFLRVHGEEDLPGLEQAEANRLATASCFILTGFQNASPTSARPATQDILFRVKLASVFRAVAADYFEVIRHAKGDLKKALLRAPIVAVAIAIMKEQPIRGAQFFKRIAEFDNLTANSPEWWMATNVLSPGKYTSKETLRLVRAVAWAWNAYYDDRQLPDFKLPQRFLNSPLELRGTSYSDREVNIPEELGEFRSALGTAPQPKSRERYKKGASPSSSSSGRRKATKTGSPAPSQEEEAQQELPAQEEATQQKLPVGE